MSRPDEDITPEELAELGALLVAERPRPSERFAAELDARVASRFAQAAAPRATDPRAAARPKSPSRWRTFLTRPLLPAAATTLAVGLVALVVTLNPGGGAQPSSSGTVSSLPGATADDAVGAAESSAGTGTSSAGDAAVPEAQSFERDSQAGGAALTDEDAAGLGGDAAKRAALKDLGGSFAALPPGSARGRKVERSASIELGARRDDVDDVAQGVLSTTARFGGIVDQSSVSAGPDGGGAQFALRIPSSRLPQALAALSRLPDAHVIARSDDQVDVNQAYVSIRRRLANDRAERTGVERALADATTEEETLRLRARLDALEASIARAERAQRGLDRRIDFSTVTLSIRTDEHADESGPFTIGRAFHDAGHVLEIAAGVAILTAAALVPLALLLACAWPLGRALRRRQREQALDAA